MRERLEYGVGSSADSFCWIHGTGITMLAFVIDGWMMRAIDECLQA